MAAATERRTATEHTPDGVGTSEVTSIVVAAPGETGGSFSRRCVPPAREAIGKALRRKEGFHLVKDRLASIAGRSLADG